MNYDLRDTFSTKRHLVLICHFFKCRGCSVRNGIKEKIKMCNNCIKQNNYSKRIHLPNGGDLDLEKVGFWTSHRHPKRQEKNAVKNI